MLFLIDKFDKFVTNLLGIEGDYVKLFVYTTLAFIIVKLLSKLLIFVYFKISKNNKHKFLFNKNITVLSNVIIFVLVVLIWEEFIKTFITLISFITAAITYSLRDTFINFFGGIYIKLNKPFNVEDRIEVDGITGDVVNITNQCFEILEVSSDPHNFQSTGSIIHVPNSKVFNTEIKNYTKVFKYKWNELDVKIPIGSDIKKCKGFLYKILRNNEVLKSIPNKMMNELNVTGEYRIYYNKVEPIVYTSFNEKFVLLTVRYLVHPKKTRNVENDIYNEILKLNKKGEFPLYIES